MLAPRVEEVSKPRVELALDVTRRKLGEQGRMPDCIKSMRYVSRDGPDLMSDIEDLHISLGEQKQHVKCRVIWSETKLVIGDEVMGETERAGFCEIKEEVNIRDGRYKRPVLK